MIDFCEDFQVNGHFSVFHEISGIFRTFPQPPYVEYSKIYEKSKNTSSIAHGNT